MGLREATGPDPLDVADDQHVLTQLWRRTGTREGARALFHTPSGDDWDEFSGDEVVERVRDVAAGLIATGVEPGDRIVIMSPTRLEWAIADLAILAAGAVTVPIYDTSSAGQCRHILTDSGPRLALVADTDSAEVLQRATEDGHHLDEMLIFDDGALDRLAERAEAGHHDEVDRRLDAIRGDHIASIVYTSGTTGDPKGCVLTHRNLVWTSRQALHRLDNVVGSDDSTLLFLPLAHIFTRVVAFACIERGTQIGFARSLDDLPDDLRSFRPTFLLAVPRVFEKVFRSARRQATGPKAKIFQLATSIGQAWSRAERPGPHLAVGRAVADRLVYAKLRSAVGGRVRYCVSGGAPLDPDLAHFFRAAGIPILEGYGLTETSAPATVNTPTEHRIGTVGRPLPGVTVRIADDGEILIRGESVFAGYHERREETDETFVDGWFASGDLGELDDDGYLWIRDRKKELIVTASGKNVSPAPLEQRISSHPVVANAMVIGDRRPFLTALVTLDPDEAAELAGDKPRGGWNESEPVRREVERAVAEANELVSRAESIRQFVVLDRDFDADEDELTQTMKLRRSVIAEHFRDEIESVYRDR